MSEAMKRCLDPEALVTLLYGEASGAEQAQAEAHVSECARCRAELEELADVRLALANWEAPAVSPGIELPAPVGARATWRHIFLPVLGGAAAAAVLLVAANAVPLELRYGADGLTFRTGAAAGRPTVREAAVPAPVIAGDSLAQPVSLGGAAPASSAPAVPEWQAAFEELAARVEGTEQSLVRVESALTSPAAAGRSTPAAAAGSDVLARVQTLIDESEVRQQQNLALRMAEMARDFDLQRRTDLVRIEQGFGRLESQHGADAAQYREVLDYIRRVSQQP